MSADIIQLRDYQQKKDLERLYSETTLEMQALEQQALEIINIALMEPGMIGMEPVIYIEVPDTAPSEYTAPDKDGA